jgi:hypothetical protein
MHMFFHEQTLIDLLNRVDSFMHKVHAIAEYHFLFKVASSTVAAMLRSKAGRLRAHCRKRELEMGFGVESIVISPVYKATEVISMKHSHSITRLCGVIPLRRSNQALTL